MQQRKARGDKNKYLKPYKSKSAAPKFSYVDLEMVLSKPSLNDFERAEFKRIFALAWNFRQRETFSYSKPIAFIYHRTGELILSLNQPEIPIADHIDVEIPYLELTSLAFSINTPDKEAKEYQKLLLKAQKTIKKGKTNWDQLIFQKNIGTGKMRVELVTDKVSE